MLLEKLYDMNALIYLKKHKTKITNPNTLLIKIQFTGETTFRR